MQHPHTTEPLDIILMKLSEMQDQLRMLDEAVRGNGKPGLNQRVAIIEERLKLVAVAFLAGLPMLWDYIKRQLGWQ